MINGRNEKSNKLKSMKEMAMKKGIFTACILVAGTLMLSGAMGVKAVDLNPSADDVVALDKLEVTTDIPIEETTTNQTFDAGKEVNQLEQVSYSKGFMIDGIKYRLYPEFQDANHAISELEKMAKDGMAYLKVNYGLESLSNSNYEEYQACVCEALGEENVYTNEALEDELYLIDGFLDIYENGDANKEILGLVNSLNGNFQGTTVEETAQATSELQLLLPYNTGADEAVAAAAEEIAADVEQEYHVNFLESDELSTGQIGSDQQAELQTYTGNSAFNVDKGITYANKYAVKRNIKYDKGFDNKDCTNFTSQIKKAGGVKEFTKWTNGSNPYLLKGSSWYFNKAGDYGAIWVNANKFANFFGVKYKTKSFYTFSTKVKRGSFITEDKKGDGNWDHMGFVTATTKIKKKYNGITYYDFRIAQHTADYHAYVSETKNHWEELTKNSKIIFAIVN